uniref:Uncharacterized protein n=1 Tax=Oryza punctata TaxID=4537 RepID=A0A0E0JMB6_ORYPU
MDGMSVVSADAYWKGEYGEILEEWLVKSFPVQLESRIWNETSDYTADQDDAFEDNEDPDLLRESFEIQHMLNSTGYGIYRGYEDLDDLRRVYENQRRSQYIQDSHESSNSSVHGSLGISIDSDWSFNFAGR